MLLHKVITLKQATMKILKPIVIATTLFIFLTGCGDSNVKKTEEAFVTEVEAATTKKDTVKQMNLLDEQAKMLSKIRKRGYGRREGLKKCRQLS